MKELITILNVTAAVLAVWRITELITLDRITTKLRQRFNNNYLLSCPRCLSVWAGIFCAVAFFYLPILNWPFALAWLYLWHNEVVIAKHAINNDRGRMFSVKLTKDGKFSVVDNELHPTELNSIMTHVLGTGVSKNAEYKGVN